LFCQARRRILAPAHRAASGPTTTAPFPPNARTTHVLDVRRASMPADSLQLYHPMTLQSLPHPSNHSEYGPARHMLGVPSGRASYGDYAPARLAPPCYPAGGGHYAMPMSAPPMLSSNPFAPHNSSLYPHHQGSLSHGFSGRIPVTGTHGQTQEPAFYPEGQSHDSASATGSGYGTPQ
jgi:hypothetical protein